MPQTRIVIDGGQTSSRIRVWTDKGRHDRSGPPIYTDRPVVEQVAVLARDALEQTGESVRALAAGVSGLTPEHARADLLQTMVADLAITSVALAHDSVSAYLAANGLADGVTSTVGTGAVTLAVGPAGAARVDGWGHLYGDAGSAYWIGRAGIDAALRAYDGRGAASTLEQRALDAFGPLPELYMVMQGRDDRVSRTAAFAEQVDSAAAHGDAVARDVLHRAAGELAASASAALLRSGWTTGRPARVSWMGKVLSHSDLVRQTFTELMAQRAPGTTIGAPAGTTLDGVASLLDVPADHALSESVHRAWGPGATAR